MLLIKIPIISMLLIAAVVISITSPVAADQWWTDDEAKLLAKLVYAEARGEPEEGQLAVAQCAVDRYFNGKYGSTLKRVITAEGQFAALSTYEDCHMEIALRVLAGERRFEGYEILYFQRSKIDKDWYAPYIEKIGEHVFYGYVIPKDE